MTDCGFKCFELQDTEHDIALEKENNQKLEAEVKRLKDIIETPCTSCCITETLEYSLDELNYQIVNQDGEIRQLKAQIEQLSNDNHVLKTSFITQQEQIEKMKCCGNCKHYDYCPMSSNIECNNPNNNLKYKWELAEK